jgi:hypothetical protein
MPRERRMSSSAARSGVARVAVAAIIAREPARVGRFMAPPGGWR